MATSPSTPPNDGVLRLQTNVPVTIALRFAEGLSVGSKFGGDQVMFSLEDGRKLFLSPTIARKMSEAGIKPGQPFNVCKCEVAQGNRRVIEYQFNLIDTGTAGSCLRPAENRSEPASNGGAGATRGEITPPSFDQKLATAINMLPAPEAVPLVPRDLSTVEYMKLAGRGAVDTVLDTEAYARSRGLTDFVFDGDAVQKIMVSLYIDLRKGGRA